MQSVNAQLTQEHPKENASVFFVMEPLNQQIVGKIRPILLILLGAVGFVLLITCANVANLVMTRSIGRRKEFAVRAALGATRGGLFSQLLTESLLLSSIGAGVGLLGAQWGVSLLVAAIPEQQLQAMPFLRNAGINTTVLLFLCAVTVLTGILFGLAPGLQASRSSLNDILKDESRAGTSTAHARLRNPLVVAEISISLVLLVGAGLLLKSPLVDGRFFTANDIKDTEGVVVVSGAFVKAYMQGENPIGKRIRFTYSAKNPYLQIVGVAADTASIDIAAPPPAIIYTPNDQGPSTFLSYLVRTAGQPSG